MLITTCDTCFLDFNETTRRPKQLRCGHTLCSDCIWKGQQCLEHDQGESMDPNHLKDDPVILKNLCLCGKEEKVLQLLAAASAGIDRAESETHCLFKRIWGSYQRITDEASAHRVRVEAAYKSVQESLSGGSGGSGCGCELGEVVAEHAARVSDSLQLQQLVGADGILGTLRLQLHTGEDVVVDLDAELEEDSAAARLLILLLHKNGKIQDLRTLGQPQSVEVVRNEKVIPAEIRTISDQIGHSEAQHEAEINQHIVSERPLHSAAEESGHQSDGIVSVVTKPTPPDMSSGPVLSWPTAKSLNKRGRRLIEILSRKYLNESGNAFKNAQAACDFGIEAVQCLADNVIRTVMKEIQDAQCFSLMIDTLKLMQGTPPLAEELVSMFVRYCNQSGKPVERLLLLRDSTASTGASLFQDFADLCERHGLDWTHTLCGVAMHLDSVRGADLLKRLQDQAPGAQLVWNSSHCMEDLIADACKEYKAGWDFFTSLESLRNFFRSCRNSTLLSRVSAAEWEGMFCDWDTYSGTIVFVERNHCTIVKALIRTVKSDVKYQTDDYARLITSLSSVPFLAVLYLFADILNSLRAFLGPAQFSLGSKMADNVILAVQSITMKHNRDCLRQYLARAEKHACSAGVAPASSREEATVAAKRALTALSRACVNAICPRLENTISALRDLEMISFLVASRREGRPARRAYQYCLASRTERRAFLHEMMCAVNMLPLSLRLASDEDVVAELIAQRSTGAGEGAGAFPNLLAGLRAVCSLPLLPATQTGKLAALRRDLLQLHGSSKALALPLLQTKMVIKFAMDSAPHWHDAETAMNALLLRVSQ